MLGMDVILVVGLRLGCLNHAFLTVEAIAARGLTLAGWVGNAIDPGFARSEANLATLAARVPAPCLGIVPWMAEPSVAPPRPASTKPCSWDASLWNKRENPGCGPWAQRLRCAGRVPAFRGLLPGSSVAHRQSVPEAVGRRRCRSNARFPARPRGLGDQHAAGRHRLSHDIYGMHMIMFWICVAIAVVVFGAMIDAMVRFRKSQGAVADKNSCTAPGSRSSGPSFPS